MNFENEQGELSSLTIFLTIILGLIGITGIFALFGSFGTVDTGSRGVVLKLQNPTGEIKDQGFYWKTPFLESVVDMTVQIQKEEVEASAASRDLQDVATKVAVNYHLDPSKVGNVYQEVRRDWAIRLVQPALQEAIKSATSKYTAEELITKRAEVREAISVNVKEKLAPRGLLIDEINIVNFAFSPSFNSSIEKKVTAEQDALASKNKLEQTKYEAQQKIEAAKGEAESIKIQSQALSEQPQFLDKLAIEKWDGTLPTYMAPGSALPFLNIR